MRDARLTYRAPLSRQGTFARFGIGKQVSPSNVPGMSIDEILRALTAAIKEQVRTEVREELIAELAGQTPKKAKQKPGPKPNSKPGPKPKAPKAAIAVSAGARRGEHEFEAARSAILQYLKGNPGSRVDQMATEIGVTVKDLQLPIAQLLKAKRLKKAGRLRGTTYTVK